MRLGSFIVLSSLFLLSCKTKEVTDPKQLISFIEDESNGLKKTVEENGFKISMTYKPIDLIAQQQMIKRTQKEYDSLRNYFSKYIYFNLTMTYDGKDLESAFGYDLGSFADKISYLSSAFSEEISLRSKKDTLDTQDYVYLRSYGVGVSNFLLVFKKPEEEHFEVDVKGYQLGFGKVSFAFDQSDIKNTPKLKLKLL